VSRSKLSWLSQRRFWPKPSTTKSRGVGSSFGLRSCTLSCPNSIIFPHLTTCLFILVPWAILFLLLTLQQLLTTPITSGQSLPVFLSALLGLHDTALLLRSLVFLKQLVPIPLPLPIAPRALQFPIVLPMLLSHLHRLFQSILHLGLFVLPPYQHPQYLHHFQDTLFIPHNLLLLVPTHPLCPSLPQ